MKGKRKGLAKQFYPDSTGKNKQEGSLKSLIINLQLNNGDC